MAVYSKANNHYVGFFPTRTFLVDFISSLPVAATLPVVKGLPATLRLSRAGGFVFAFNYANTTQDVKQFVGGARFILGDSNVLAHSLSVWEDINDGQKQ